MARMALILLAAMGEPLTPDELETFKTFTGRDTPPTAAR